MNREQNWQRVLKAQISHREAIRAAALGALNLLFARISILARSAMAASAADYALRLA